jgi:ferric-dicitrate binding protein FerR (iron transport regulator)
MSDCWSLRERYFGTASGSPADREWLDHLRTCSECRVACQAMPQVDAALSEIARLAIAAPAFDEVAGAAARAARSQRRRRAVRRSAPFLYTALGTAALAAGLIAIVWLGRARQLAPKLLSPGAEIQTTAESKSATLDSGVRIRLEAGSLKLASSTQEGQVLLLPLGRVFVEVPKLAPGRTLSVRTPDAEVRVHGTRFQVIRTSKETQVDVTEGVVEVRPEGGGRAVQTVKAGESTTVPSAEMYRETLRHSTLEALEDADYATAERQIGQLLQTSPIVVEQAEAQALLAWSLSGRGKRSEAIDRYRQALALLPHGHQPLWAENACAELAILVQRMRPKESASTWAECLRRFPDGVHAILARSAVQSRR